MTTSMWANIGSDDDLPDGTKLVHEPMSSKGFRGPHQAQQSQEDINSLNELEKYPCKITSNGPMSWLWIKM